MVTLKVFIGYDSKESVAWHTLAHSIYTLSSSPVSITPLKTSNLRGLYQRENDARQSNAFSYTRFLVPYLCDYEGWALYLDCDMLVRFDLSELFQPCKLNPSKAVSVVQHDYTSKVKTKYLGNKQYNYPRKNWSSAVLWNCSHVKNKQITPEVVNEQSPAFLHRFQWLEDEEIGQLDKKYNWLVGEYTEGMNDAKIIHWTLGGPYFHEHSESSFSDEWFRSRDQMLHCDQLDPVKN